MKPTDFLLCLVYASGGSIQGRTLLQKRAFFVNELIGEDLGLKFNAHYYGPYSATVEGTTIQLKNLGFIQESSSGFGILSDGFEIRRYDYSLTEDGNSLVRVLTGTPEFQKIREAVDRISTAGNPNYLELSIAAKAYFLIKKKNGGMSVAELSKQAERYNWNLPPGSVERAVGFLSTLGLTRVN